MSGRSQGQDAGQRAPLPVLLDAEQLTALRELARSGWRMPTLPELRGLLGHVAALEAARAAAPAGAEGLAIDVAAVRAHLAEHLREDQSAHLWNLAAPCCEADEDGDGECPLHTRYMRRGLVDDLADDVRALLAEVERLRANAADLADAVTGAARARAEARQALVETLADVIHEAWIEAQEVLQADGSDGCVITDVERILATSIVAIADAAAALTDAQRGPVLPRDPAAAADSSSDVGAAPAAEDVAPVVPVAPYQRLTPDEVNAWAPKGPWSFVVDGDDDETFYVLLKEGRPQSEDHWTFDEAANASRYVAWKNREHAAMLAQTQALRDAVATLDAEEVVRA